MTTSNPDDGSPTPEPSSPAPDPAPDADSGGSPPDVPAGRRRRWRERINTAKLLTYSGVVAGTVATALLTPLGERVVGSFFDDPSCPGVACDGKSPEKHGCFQDARTYQPVDDNPAVLQIRWSEQCHAVGGKIKQGNKGDLVTARAEGNDERSAEIDYGHDTYTSMVAVENGGFEARVCAIPAKGSGSTFRRYCIHATDAAAWR